MRPLLFCVFATLLLTPHLHAETGVDQEINALIIHTDEITLTNTARDILRILDAAQAGDIGAIDANAALFDVFVSDVAAASVIYWASIRKSQEEEGMSRQLTDLITNIADRTTVFTDFIAPKVSKSTDIETYLQQVSLLNRAILTHAGPLLADDPDIVAVFKRYQSLVGPLEQALGYVDYTTDRHGRAYWPRGDDAHSSYKYINLFRNSDAEQAKSLRFMDYFDGLPPSEQLAAFAWVYDASFESYLAVAPIQSDLPPWITSDALRQLHRTINDAIMAEFANDEMEMFQ